MKHGKSVAAQGVWELARSQVLTLVFLLEENENKFLGKHAAILLGNLPQTDCHRECQPPGPTTATTEYNDMLRVPM